MSSVDLTPWQSSPSVFRPDGRTVHLWRFRLDLPEAEVTTQQLLLSADERGRAARLLDREKARRFIVARGRLRQILAYYLNRPPEHIEFNYSEHGKPFLKGDGQLSFNLAHTGDWGVLAITAEAEIGVDLERVDLQMVIDKIAERFFSATEQLNLQQYSPVRRRRGFLRIWTRKEAVLKGRGCGFSLSMTDDSNRQWQFRSFTVERGYLGTLAIASHVTTVQRWSFDTINAGLLDKP